MSNRLTPMLGVQDIAEMMGWYQDIGFQVTSTNQDFCPEDEVNWCMLEFQGNRVMLNLSPQRVSRNLTLNLDVDDVQAVHDAIDKEPEIPLGDRFYGRRDFEIRDPQGNGLLIGQTLKP